MCQWSIIMDPRIQFGKNTHVCAVSRNAGTDRNKLPRHGYRVTNNIRALLKAESARERQKVRGRK